LLGGPLAAQQRRPLDTEDAETTPLARVLLELGFEHQRFPAGGPAPRERTGLPVVGLRIGLGPHAELQVDYRFLFTDPGVEDQGSIIGTGDAQLAVKLRLPWSPSRSTAVGLKLATKLPNATERNRLGTDETDVLLLAVGHHDFGRLRLIANGGLGILGDTDTPQAQDDVDLLRVALVWPRAEPRAFALEWTGQLSSDPRLELGELRLGGRFRTGALSWDLAAGFGTRGVSPDWSLRAGWTLTVRN
jgi:hypothetical protein